MDQIAQALSELGFGTLQLGIFDAELITCGRIRRAHRLPEAGRKILLTSGDALPNVRLTPFQFRRKASGFGVQRVSRAAEMHLAFFFSSVPPAALDAKSGN